MQESLRDPAGLLERAPELGELARADAAVRKALARGDPRGLHRALWWVRILGRLKPQRATVDALLAHRRLFAVPFKRSPALGTVNGVGASLYGKSDGDLDGSYIKTHFLVFAFVPVFPFAQYLVRDAENGGWYVMAKVPTSQWLRLWRGAVVAAVAAAVGVAAIRTLHASRHHDVHVVNSLPVPVAVQMGAQRLELGAGERRAVTVPVGRHAVSTADPGGRVLESGEIVVEAGAHVLAWNVLGAASVFERDVTYFAKGTAPPAEDTPRFHCGARAIRIDGVQDLFQDPPQTINMPDGLSYAKRRHVDRMDGTPDGCAGLLSRRRDARAGLTLADELVRLGRDDTTTLAVGLYRSLGRMEDAVALARTLASRSTSTVDQHRLYQDVAEEHGLVEPVRTEYRARAEADPASADAAYLYARTLPAGEAFARSGALVRRFPDSVPCIRLRLYGAVRRHLFGEAATLLEQLRRLAPAEWAGHLEEHAEVLAALRRVDEAKKLLEIEFVKVPRHEQVRLAAIHHWLTGGSDAAADVLYQRLGTKEASDALRFRVRFWEAPQNVPLAPLLPVPEHALHRLSLHARFDPPAAVAEIPKVRTGDIAGMDAEVLLLLLGEASRVAQPVVRQRLDAAAAEAGLPVPAIAGYLERAEWTEELEQMELPAQGALHLGRSRRPGIAPAERDRLRALAARCDPVGGFVAKALSSWPAP